MKISNIILLSVSTALTVTGAVAQVPAIMLAAILPAALAIIDTIGTFFFDKNTTKDAIEAIDSITTTKVDTVVAKAKEDSTLTAQQLEELKNDIRMIKTKMNFTPKARQE